MTGLDAERDVLLEVACVLTCGCLRSVVRGPQLVIHRSESVLRGMNAWCAATHGASGLTQRVRESCLTEREVEDALLAFLERHGVARGVAPLAGNSVHADRAFLVKAMPRLMQHLHYRIVDVSSVKELCRRWYPCALARAPRKAARHRAMDDIVESIDELAYYRRNIFR